MVRCSLPLIITLLLTYFEAYSQVYPNDRVDFLLKSGINSIINQDYETAKGYFNSLTIEFPDLPLGKIYLAANKIAEEYDYGEDYDEEFILTNLDEAREQSENLMDSDEVNIWYEYFYALAEGYTAYFHALNESWFSALNTGYNSISEFEKILTADKNFYEAYIAIGTFQYWKSRKTEFMDWLPFNNDTRKIGIERLIVAIDSSSYNSYLAINSLIWIYVDQKKYEDAISVSKKALTKFPDSRTFKWGMARAYEEIDPLKAIALYNEILNSYPVLKNEKFKNEITLKHIIAQQYAKLGNKKNALKYCNEILSIKNLPEKTADELANRLERVKVLKTEILNEK